MDMWQRLKGYVFLGFAAGLFGIFIHGLGGTLLAAILFAFILKACYSLYRSERALRQDRKAIQAGNAPRELVAWKEERSSNPIEQKYKLGWFSSIGIGSILLAILPPQIAGKMMAYFFLAAVGFLAFYILRLSHSRAQFFRAFAKHIKKHEAA